MRNTWKKIREKSVNLMRTGEWPACLCCRAVPADKTDIATGCVGICQSTPACLQFAACFNRRHPATVTCNGVLSSHILSGIAVVFMQM